MCQKGYELTIVYTALCLSFLVKNLFNWNVASIHSETVGLEISYFIMKDWTPHPWMRGQGWKLNENLTSREPFCVFIQFHNAVIFPFNYFTSWESEIKLTIFNNWQLYN